MRRTVDIYEPKVVDSVIEELKAAKRAISIHLTEKSREHAVRRLDRAINMLKGEKNNEGS